MILAAEEPESTPLLEPFRFTSLFEFDRFLAPDWLASFLSFSFGRRRVLTSNHLLNRGNEKKREKAPANGRRLGRNVGQENEHGREI